MIKNIILAIIILIITTDLVIDSRTRYPLDHDTSWQKNYQRGFKYSFVCCCLSGLLIESKVDNMPAVRMYRGMFLIILMIFCLGLNTYGWRKVGVNHVLIFELDPRNNLSHEQLLEVRWLIIWHLWSAFFLDTRCIN